MEGPTKTAAIAAMKQAIGSEIGVSDWITLDQPMVSAFAELTGDTYFIHVDPERAKRATPWGGTIAHGFLTMSWLANMSYQVMPFVEGTKSMLNYGFNRLRFIAPVPTGSRVRGRFKLLSFEVQPTRWQSAVEVTVEIDGKDKPALVAEWLHAGLI